MISIVAIVPCSYDVKVCGWHHIPENEENRIESTETFYRSAYRNAVAQKFLVEHNTRDWLLYMRRYGMDGKTLGELIL